MLVLTRNAGQVIRIGDDVTITILNAKHGKIKIGIDAPKDVAIHREEIYQRLQQNRTISTSTERI